MKTYAFPLGPVEVKWGGFLLSKADESGLVKDTAVQKVPENLLLNLERAEIIVRQGGKVWVTARFKATFKSEFDVQTRKAVASPPKVNAEGDQITTSTKAAERAAESLEKVLVSRQKSRHRDRRSRHGRIILGSKIRMGDQIQ